MTLRTAPKKVINRITQQEQLNFLLTNRIPRRYATILIGWLSKRENVIVRTILLTLWRIFSDLDLSEAKKRKFKSVHDCFTRELKDGARPVDMAEGSLVARSRVLAQGVDASAEAVDEAVGDDPAAVPEWREAQARLVDFDQRSQCNNGHRRPRVLTVLARLEVEPRFAPRDGAPQPFGP